MQSNYLSKAIALKEKGLIDNIKNVVLFDGIINEEEKQKIESFGVKVHTFNGVMDVGRKSDVVLEPEKVNEDDTCYLFYTSGTTGDSKGAKATHRSMLGGGILGAELLPFTEDEIHMSYLPSPHAFESWLFVSCLVGGSKIGYYTGDPTKLTDDC